MTQRRIAELLSKEGPRIRKRFLAVMQRVRDQRTIAQIEQALTEGRIAEVLDDVERAAAATASRIEATINLAGHEAAEYLAANLDKLVSYDSGNPRAVDLIRANRLRIVTSITEKQRQALATVLSEGTAAGINPRQMAKRVRDVIGLSATQAAKVTAYRQRLETPTPLNPDTPVDPEAPPAPKVKARTEEQIDRMVDRFAAQQLKQRAAKIARTEAKSAVDEGLAQGFGQAIENGTIAADQIEQKWLAGDPPRTRAHHASMDQQVRPWGEPFVSGLGNSLRWPGDITAPPAERDNCRCGVARRIVRKPSTVEKGALMSTERIFIAGAPRTGKTDRSAELAASLGLPVLHTDDFRAMEWSEASAHLAKLAGDGQPRIVEGVRVPHVLRKMLEAAPTVKPCDRLIVLRVPRAPQTAKQVSMGKAAETVLDGILARLIDLGVQVDVEPFPV